jgi:hypothetical protein
MRTMKDELGKFLQQLDCIAFFYQAARPVRKGDGYFSVIFDGFRLM